MSGINLSKGGRINLAKTAPLLKKIRIGLAWGENQYDTGQAYDLDCSVFLLKDSNSGKPKLISDKHFVFYNNETDPEGAVLHHGDNRTGDGDGDDEKIDIELSKLNPAADELSFVVTIHDADVRKQNFGQIPGSKVTLYNQETGEVIAFYELEADYSSQTAIQFCSLKKRADGTWDYVAAGHGFNSGLADFVKSYGGNAN